MQRNFIAFILVSAAILAGWFYFVTPTPPPNKDEKKIAQVEKKTPPEIAKTSPVGKTVNVPPVVGKKDPAEKIADDEPDHSESLGGDGFHISARLTARGAAVQQVTLNRFDRADWRGTPTKDKLELIQDDPFAPSFRMYHYENPKDDNPVFGLGEKNWKFLDRPKRDDNAQEVRFATTVPDTDIEVIKTYTLAPKDYHITLKLEFARPARPAGAKEADPGAFDFRYQLTGAQGLPIEGEWYATTFRNAYIGLVDESNRVYRKLEESMRISPRRGGDTFPDNKFHRANSRLQYAIVANQYFAAGIVVDDKQPDADKILAWARPTLESSEMRGTISAIKGDFIDFRDTNGKVSTLRLLPRTKQHIEDLGLEPQQKAILSYYLTPKLEVIASWIRLGDTPRGQFDDITVRVNSEKISLHPGGRAVHQYLLYHGPVKAALLGQFTGDKEVPSELVARYTHTLHLRTLTDYKSDNFFGTISSTIYLTDLIIQVTRFMHWVLNFLQPVFGYGLSIVVLTVMVRGAMFPISRKQAIFSIKMQELAPELKKVQDKHADDPQAKMQATQEFYKKHGINPLGSCWPVFLQMPIFLGLYFAFQESIHFRGADFLWIKSLSAPDMLFGWGEMIPYISTPDHLGSMFYLGPFMNILPICAVVLMMIQQMQTMPPPTDEQQAMQQKMLKFMSIFFGIMFYKVAAGLCIYFVASSLWGMAERKLLPKKKTDPAMPASGSAPPSTAVAAGPPKGKWSKPPKKEKPDETTAFGKIKAWWQDVLKQAEKK